MDSVIKNAARIDLSDQVPPTAVGATISISVEPRTGRILIYSPADIDHPVIFNGPDSTHDIALAEEKVVFVQMVSGAMNFRLSVLGWKDNL